MKPNELEIAVLRSFLADREQHPAAFPASLDSLNVTDRALTGAGFLTEFERSRELKWFQDGVSMRWGNVGARLNAPRLETGYLVYVDDGYVTAVEGYTYGDPWPEHVDSIEVYELKPGMKLATTLG